MLRRIADHARVVGSEPFPVEVDATAAWLFEAQQRIQRSHELDKPFVSLPRRELRIPEHERVEPGSAGPDAEQEAATCDVIDGRQVFWRMGRGDESWGS